MKTLAIIAGFLFLSSFTQNLDVPIENDTTLEEVAYASFSLINDTKKKVSIHTGSGFVSLNKGSKTSITCNKGKEVRWADSGKKGDVIFKISSDHCGKTLKLSNFL